jgi:hypothetical protein
MKRRTTEPLTVTIRPVTMELVRQLLRSSCSNRGGDLMTPERWLGLLVKGRPGPSRFSESVRRTAETITPARGGDSERIVANVPVGIGARGMSRADYARHVIAEALLECHVPYEPDPTRIAFSRGRRTPEREAARRAGWLKTKAAKRDLKNKMREGRLLKRVRDELESKGLTRGEAKK